MTFSSPSARSAATDRPPASTHGSSSGARDAVVATADHDLLAMLRVIGDQDTPTQSLDSTTVSRSLGWTDALTATTLGQAKARLLVWGIRVGGTPCPRFEDIELTVQGHRLVLAARDTTPEAGGAECEEVA